MPAPSPTQQTNPAPEIRFATTEHAGGFDFSTHGGHVRATVSATSPYPSDLAPLGQTDLSTTPDDAEAIGYAWIAWAHHARNEQNRRAPSHAAHSHVERAN